MSFCLVSGLWAKRVNIFVIIFALNLLVSCSKGIIRPILPVVELDWHLKEIMIGWCVVLRIIFLGCFLIWILVESHRWSLSFCAILLSGRLVTDRNVLLNILLWGQFGVSKSKSIVSLVLEWILCDVSSGLAYFHFGEIYLQFGNDLCILVIVSEVVGVASVDRALVESLSIKV